MEGATFWPTPQTPVFTGGTSLTGIAGNEVVSRTSQLFLWNGVTFSSIDLKPAGATGAGVFATDGQQQGGRATFGGHTGPAIWSGTPNSYVDLTPRGFPADGEVAGLWGGIQVGDLGGQAALWEGTPSSYVNLNPFSVTTASSAAGVSRGQVVGAVGVSGTATHAAVWTGQTAASFVDLNPSFASSSELSGTNGTQQGGDFTARINGGLVSIYPAVWHGTAATAQALPLPAGYTVGKATAIDSDGDIAGWATPGSSEGIALLWIPHRLPGDANFDGKVDFQDLMTLAHHYGQAGEVGYVDGDFDMDQKVDFGDLVILARNYGAGTPAASELAQLDPSFRADVQRAFADVPEPSSALLAAVACPLLLRRRRQARHRE